MQNRDVRERIIADVCAEFELAPDLIRQLLELENRHRDLLAWGARPNLRRDISRVLDTELQKIRAPGFA